MSEVIVVVEGPTEQTFVREVLAPWLGYKGVSMNAALVGKPGHKGGNFYKNAKRDMLNFLKQRGDIIVTSMFDYYGMRNDWPGRNDAESANHDSKPVVVEKAVKQDVEKEFGDMREDRLFPYVQMHEFESLLFSYPSALAMALANKNSVDEFQEIRDDFQTPEHINDDPNTAPSKRVARVFRDYGRKYQKPLHGSIAAKGVTIETMRSECPHFRTWVDKLVALEI